VLSSPVFAKPELRPPILIFLPRALAPRAGSYDTHYLGSPHPRILRPVAISGTSRAFCGSRAEILLPGFTFNSELSTLDLVIFRPSRGLCELRIKNSPSLHPNRPAPPITAPQNIAKSPLQTASPRRPLHQSANSRSLFSIRCVLFCNYGGGGGSPFVPGFVFPISSFVFRPPLSPLESALTSQCRVLPSFGRNCYPLTPAESRFTKDASASRLESALTKKGGGGGCCRIS
jgi:hypothetical protein